MVLVDVARDLQVVETQLIFAKEVEKILLTVVATVWKIVLWIKQKTKELMIAGRNA